MKPIGRPTRAFSRTWRLFRGRAKSDSSVSLSLSLSLSHVLRVRDGKTWKTTKKPSTKRTTAMTKIGTGNETDTCSMIGSETTRIHWRSIVDASTGKARIFMPGTVTPTWTRAKTPDGVPRRKKRRQKPAKISATSTNQNDSL